MPQFKLNDIQKKIIVRTKKEWYGGDDNDFSCWLSSVKMDAYKAGLFDYAYHIHRHDPMALECDRADFLAYLENQIAVQEGWEEVYAAHDRAMGQAG